MSSYGETPNDDDRAEVNELAFGTTLYTEDGTEVGTIRGMTNAGVFVTVREGVEELSVEHARSGHNFGMAELMWRCTVCGEMGEIGNTDGGLPEACPNCDAQKEEMAYWTED